MALRHVWRPSIVTGVTADGWMEYRSGDVIIFAYDDHTVALPYDSDEARERLG